MVVVVGSSFWVGWLLEPVPIGIPATESGKEVDSARSLARASSSLLEKAVRKLLIASQKSGVGKTTTSINLAAATAMAGARVLLLDADPVSSISSALRLSESSNRQPLRDAGIDLPGVLYSSVVPGLDVLCPYEQGGCSDEEFDELLRLLACPTLRDGYGCLVVDTPPFMGGNPAQLLGACDDFVLVMRAEPMAYRTLPAFLELVQRAKNGRNVHMAGILLTLPEGEQADGRWERELRGRFGGRVLPHVIPFDENVVTAGQDSVIVAQAKPHAPAAAQYHRVTELLALAADGSGTLDREDSPVLAAAAALAAAGTPVGRVLAAVGAPGTSTEDTVVDNSPGVLTAHLPSAVVPPVAKTPAPRQRPESRPPSHSGMGGRRKSRPPSNFNTGSVPDLADGLAQAPAAKSSGPRKTSPDRPVPPVAPSKEARKVGSKQQPPRDAGLTWLVWVALAGAGGVGLRFLPAGQALQVEAMVPLAVGIAVAFAVVLVLTMNQSTPKKSSRSSKAPPKEKDSNSALRTVSVKRPAVPPRGEGKKDADARLTMLVRRTPRGDSRRG